MADRDEGDPNSPETYANIREILAMVIGRRIVTITQQDAAEWQETRSSYVCFCFDNGVTLTFPIGEMGFQVEEP